MGHRVVTPATELPVSMDLVMSHLLMDDDVAQAQQALVSLYVGSAVGHIEETCGHAMGRQTWLLELDAWQRVINLPGGNILAVTEVAYTDAAGVRHVVAPADYLVRLGVSGTVRPPYGGQWPSARSGNAEIEITYDVGYEDGAVPKALQQALLLLVGDFDANKGTKVEGQWAESPTYKRLIWPFKAISA